MYIYTNTKIPDFDTVGNIVHLYVRLKESIILTTPEHEREDKKKKRFLIHL